MGDAEEEVEKPFAVEKAKTGRAKCKKCKCPIQKDVIRIAKLMSNPFGEGKMKSWHHVACLFEVFAKQRASTKRIDDPEEDVSGWNDLNDEDKNVILQKLEDFEKSAPYNMAKGKTPKKQVKDCNKTKDASSIKPKKASPKNLAKASPKKKLNFASNEISNELENSSSKPGTSGISKESEEESSRDNSFREFRRICSQIAAESAYTGKTAILKTFFTKGSEAGKFQGDSLLWCKMLLPGAVKRIYNLRSKQLIKLFARIFGRGEDEMLDHLDLGDVAETVRVFFEKSSSVKPSSRSRLSLAEVDGFLEELSQLTKEEEQTCHIGSIVGRCTANDLKMIVRLIKHDLRINAGPKHVLEAIHEDAYKAFQVSRDLDAVIERCLSVPEDPSTSASPSLSPKGSKVALALMTPVLPMLAEACKSVEMATRKCPSGMFAEVKYDGERVQIHKRGSDFRYFSRSLKPVLAHKVNHFKDYIPKAFPDGDDLILDTEILLIDNKTGKPLPFGTLGKHKVC